MKHIADVVSDDRCTWSIITPKRQIGQPHLHHRKSIIGQQDAVEKVVKSIQRNRAGLKAQQSLDPFFAWSNWCWENQLLKSSPARCSIQKKTLSELT